MQPLYVLLSLHVNALCGQNMEFLAVKCRRSECNYGAPMEDVTDFQSALGYMPRSTRVQK